MDGQEKKDQANVSTGSSENFLFPFSSFYFTTPGLPPTPRRVGNHRRPKATFTLVHRVARMLTQIPCREIEGFQGQLLEAPT